MANAGPNDNQSQFFFTLGATPELNGKHTIFGKVILNLACIKEDVVDCHNCIRRSGTVFCFVSLLNLKYLYVEYCANFTCQGCRKYNLQHDKDGGL